MSDNTKRVGWLDLDVYAFTSTPKVTQTAIPVGDDGYGTGDLLELIDDMEDDVTLFDVIPGILGQADTYALPVDEPAALVAAVAAEVAQVSDGGLFPVLAALVPADGMLF